MKQGVILQLLTKFFVMNITSSDANYEKKGAALQEGQPVARHWEKPSLRMWLTKCHAV
jgi:hypothetical protein